MRTAYKKLKEISAQIEGHGGASIIITNDKKGIAFVSIHGETELLLAALAASYKRNADFKLLIDISLKL